MIERSEFKEGGEILSIELLGSLYGKNTICEPLGEISYFTHTHLGQTRRGMLLHSGWPPVTMYSERVHRRRGDGNVVENLRHRLPQGEPRHAIGIEWHDDRVAWEDTGRAVAEHPAAVVRDDAAARTHDVDMLLVGLARQATALANVAIAA
jgi:hypothetical protein